jgi:hypothetical protein
LAAWSSSSSELCSSSTYSSTTLRSTIFGSWRDPAWGLDVSVLLRQRLKPKDQDSIQHCRKAAARPRRNRRGGARRLAS